MIVAGGVYHEKCEFPPDSKFFGPGLRGVAAIQQITDAEDSLYCCISDDDSKTLQEYSNRFGFTLEATTIPETVTFYYLHNHSNPKQQPRNASQFGCELTGIEGEAVLQYGLVEGTAVVNGTRVVYDPQNSDPEPFQSNGSQAEELALVLNRQEAESLASESDITQIFEELMGGVLEADVVIIKQGARGALVRVDGKISEVPVYKTDDVWGIGSGDVFSAVFAALWAEQGIAAEQAAMEASLATAYYCSTRQLPIPEDLEKVMGFDPTAEFVPPDAARPTVYLAAPFFDIGELWLVEEVRRILNEEGVAVTSPYHDIGSVADYESTEAVADHDLSALEASDLVFTLLDNDDSGTYFELGYAKKAGIPVVGYEHDPDYSEYTMLTGTNCEIYGDLASAIFNGVWQAYA